MWWLWIVGPIAAGLIFVLTGKVDQRALKEIDIWRENLGTRRSKLQKKAKGEGKKKKAKDLRPKPFGALSRDFAQAIEDVGEGRVLGTYELAPKVAYARFVLGDAEGGSDHQTVFVRLAEPGPTLTARPLPLLDDNNRVANTGIEFRKDPEFFSTYLVDADASVAKAIGKWLSRDLRTLLCENGEVWLHVRGRAMALTVYGPIRAEKITALMELAEVFVAEHGAEDGPSLFGETDRTSVKEKANEDDDAEDAGEEDDA
jgi:hypothetical protein